MRPRALDSVVHETRPAVALQATALLRQSVGRVHHSLAGIRADLHSVEDECAALRNGRAAFETELAWMRGSLAEARSRHRYELPSPSAESTPAHSRHIWIPAVGVSIALHAFLLTSPYLSLDPPPPFLLPTQDSSFIHILSISELQDPAVRRSIAPPMATPASPDPALPGSLKAAMAAPHPDETPVAMATAQRALDAQGLLETPQDGAPERQDTPTAPTTPLSPTDASGVVFVRAPKDVDDVKDAPDTLAISDRNVASTLLDRSALTALTEGQGSAGQGSDEGENTNVTSRKDAERGEAAGVVLGATGANTRDLKVELAGSEPVTPEDQGSHALTADAGLEPLPTEAIVSGTHTLITPGDRHGAPQGMGDAAAAPTGNTQLDVLAEASAALPNASIPEALGGKQQSGRNLDSSSNQARRWGLNRRDRPPGQASDRLARLGQVFRLRGRAQKTIAQSVSAQASAQQPSAPMSISSGGASRSPVTVVPDIVALGNASRVPSRETPMGRYLAGVDAHLRAGWILPLEVRALGIQGACEVTFTVDSRGRVQDKHLSRRSGRQELDGLALSAVPHRLKRMPTDLPLETLTVRYTFRSTDTLIAGSR